ncbi:synaptotagmin-like protein 4 isoform X2 [Hippocampus comes]|uniref:synaptotagmin-like protein 4 isoform X2 n=1 Tax=Hippocampus comes TaxID=109280 RepID=UPI00094E9DC6|nr:PREDICTED: synaptotagmin-like protein 4 isoform X2 [Hippocampus comes]
MPQPIDNIDLDFLSDTERDLILEVLRRDEVLRQAEEQRIRKLKAELLEIKRKGAKRGSIRYSQRSCARCHGSLSLLAFSSNHCQCCHHLVCRKCRANLPDGSWLCSVCVKESDMRKSTGDWFYNLRVNRFSTMPGHELVRSSLRKRPAMKKYATMGDVLLRNSDSSRGPPVPVPRHKVSATDKRENSDSVTSTASFEPKEDGIFSHGPPSEYSGSVASTVSFERKGIDDLFKPSQSDAELSELTSLTSSKTGHESGRVTPDLPRRAVLPPHYNQSSVTLLPDAISIHSYSCEAEAAPEINQAIPSQEFDVDKLFKKSIQHVHDPPDDGMDVGKQPDSYKVPVEVKSQFGQLLDTQVPEIKQVIPSPDFDVDEFFKKSIESKSVYNEMDVYDQSHLYETLIDVEREFVQNLDTQVTEVKQASPRPEFDVDKLFEKSVKPIENHPERVYNELDVYDQSHLYEALIDVERQFDQRSDTQVTEIKQASPSSEFDVDKLFEKSVKPIENHPERVYNEMDVYDQSHLYETLIDVKRQFVQGLDTQVTEIKQASPSSEFDVDKLFEKSVKPIENHPERVYNEMDVYDQSHLYETLIDVKRQFVQGLDTQVPKIKQANQMPELDVEKFSRKSVKHFENPPEFVKHGLDICDRPDSYEVAVAAKRQFERDFDMQVPEIEQAVPSREFDVDEHFKTVNNIENHPERANIGLEVSDQSHSYQNLADIKTQSVHGLAMEVTEIKQVSPNPEFDVENLSRKGLKHIENPPACVENEPDVCDQPHSHAIPVPAPRQFVKGLNTQVPKMKQASSSPEFDGDELFKKSVKNIENPPDCLKYGLEVCDQPDMYETVLDVTSQFEQSLDTQNPEIKQVCPSPELDVQKLFKKSVTRTQNIHEHHSTLDLRDNRDTLTVPMGNRSQSVPDLDMQDDEEEDIDSLVNTHRNSMASSASSMSVSMTSIYSDSGDSYSVDVRGEVVFSMFYDEPTQSLQVLIKECRKLACGDSLRQFSNPYVKCYLLPDKSRQSKRKTTIKRHTCDPVYEETFKYNIRRNQLLTRSMLISVWHHGHLGSNPFLGEVEIALDCYDLDCPQEECMALMTKAPCCIPASAFTQFKGELMISLKYVTPKGPRLQKFKGKKVVEVEGGELHILIKEAKNLMAMKGGGGTSDSFVKGYLFPSKSKTTKRKTPVVKKSLNPHYGHTFVYKELTLEQLRTMCLELTVWDREPMLSNEFLGGVRLSSGEGTVKIGNQEVEMDSVGEEVSLWKKMMQYPDSWAEGTLPLRTTMRKKKGK